MLNVEILHMDFLVMIINCYTTLQKNMQNDLNYKSFALKNYELNLNSRDSMFANFDKILFCTAHRNMHFYRREGYN